jgi:hypothetical protein
VHELLHQYVGGAAAQQNPHQPGAAAARARRRAAAAVFAAGELALLRVARPPGGLTVLLQALTAPRLLPGMAAAAAGCDDDAAMVDAGVPAPGGEAGEEGSGAAAGAGVVGVDVPVSLQGHAWISLGKVCLVDEPLAKRLVPLFVQVRRRAG